MTITGDLLKKMRMLRDVKQQTMAKALGITQPSYCQLEQSACIHSERLKTILDILNFKEEQVEKLREFCQK